MKKMKRLAENAEGGIARKSHAWWLQAGMYPISIEEQVEQQGFSSTDQILRKLRD